MKVYKTKDFKLNSTQEDVYDWMSTDRKFSISTSSHNEAKYFVYKKIHDNWEWIGIQELGLAEAVDELNKMIQNGEIEKYV